MISINNLLAFLVGYAGGGIVLWIIVKLSYQSSNDRDEEIIVAVFGECAFRGVFFTILLYGYKILN